MDLAARLDQCRIAVDMGVVAGGCWRVLWLFIKGFARCLPCTTLRSNTAGLQLLLAAGCRSSQHGCICAWHRSSALWLCETEKRGIAVSSNSRVSPSTHLHRRRIHADSRTSGVYLQQGTSSSHDLMFNSTLQTLQVQISHMYHPMVHIARATISSRPAREKPRIRHPAHIPGMG